MQVGTNIRYKHPLKAEIYSRGLTVKEFANNAQLNRHTMMNIFQQKHKATATTIRLIADALDLPIMIVERMIKNVENS